MRAENPEPGLKRSPLRLALALLPMVGFLALAALFYFRLGVEDPSALHSALVGKSIPTFSLPGLEGVDAPALTPEIFRSNRPVVLNVFASWCAPCRQEHKELMALKAQGVAVVGLGYKDKPDNLKKFIDNFGNPYAAIGVDQPGRAAIELGVYGVPETFIISPGGKITARHVGAVTAEKVRAELEKMNF